MNNTIEFLDKIIDVTNNKAIGAIDSKHGYVYTTNYGHV